MNILPSPDSIIIIFFTIFCLSIFQYVFFFNVTAKTFADVVIKIGSEMLGDKFVFSNKENILKSLGKADDLYKKYIGKIDSVEKNNIHIRNKAKSYILISGLIFLGVLALGITFMIYKKYDMKKVLPNMLISIFLVIAGFTTELYLYYYVMLPYKYTSKYELVDATLKAMENIVGKSNFDAEKLIECLTQSLTGTKCDLQLPNSIINMISAQLNKQLKSKGLPEIPNLNNILNNNITSTTQATSSPTPTPTPIATSSPTENFMPYDAPGGDDFYDNHPVTQGATGG